MLVSLKVSNFAIIENIRLNFDRGLNIISGETGAGKSILLKSLSFLMGDKGTADSVRSGAKLAVVEGEFDLTHRKDIAQFLLDLGIEVDGHVAIRRAIGTDGKAKNFLNDSSVTLQTLKNVVGPLLDINGHAPLVEITGQFENRNLAHPQYQLELLDQYCATTEMRYEFAKSYSDWRATARELETLKQSKDGAQSKLDFLSFQLSEIKAIDPIEGEDQKIEMDLKAFKNQKKIQDLQESIDNLLSSGESPAISILEVCLKRLKELNALQPNTINLTSRLSAQIDELKEVSYCIRKGSGQSSLNYEDAENLEARLSGLRKLQKKYGGDLASVLQAASEIEEEIDLISKTETRVAELQQKLDSQEKALREQAETLHRKRKAGVKLLADSTNAELVALNMNGVVFDTNFKKLETLNQFGFNEMEFLVQSGKDKSRLLGKVASGGELSRILLALKRVLGSMGVPRTFIFDEVDAGISGETASRVGAKLKSIAQSQQVICVTHLAQVAAFADHHFNIEKTYVDEIPSMKVQKLSEAGQVKEIARLMAGNKLGKSVLEHAKSLIHDSGKLLN